MQLDLHSALQAQMILVNKTQTVIALELQDAVRALPSSYSVSAGISSVYVLTTIDLKHVTSVGLTSYITMVPPSITSLLRGAFSQ